MFHSEVLVALCISLPKMNFIGATGCSHSFLQKSCSKVQNLNSCFKQQRVLTLVQPRTTWYIEENPLARSRPVTESESEIHGTWQVPVGLVGSTWYIRPPTSTHRPRDQPSLARTMCTVYYTYMYVHTYNCQLPVSLEWNSLEFARVNIVHQFQRVILRKGQRAMWVMSAGFNLADCISI